MPWWGWGLIGVAVGLVLSEVVIHRRRSPSTDDDEDW